MYITYKKYRSSYRNCNSFYPGLQELEILVRFFMHLIICLHTRSCTSHFVHLKQSFVNTCVNLAVHLLQNRNILEQKVNLRSIPLTINLQPSLAVQIVFTGKETTDGSLVYPGPNSQTSFCQLCLKAMNMVGPSQFFGLRQQCCQETF